MTDRIYSVRFPIIARHFDSYADFLRSPIKCIVGEEKAKGNILNTKQVLKGKLANEGDILYKGTYIYLGEDSRHIAQLLDTPLDGYVVLDNSANSGSNQIPDNPYYFKLVREEEVYMHADGRYSLHGIKSQPFYRIYPHETHKTLNDLCQNCFKYSLKNNCFVYSENIKDHILGFMKGNIRYLISHYLGDIDERMADYSKLIYFILSKLELTENEKEIVDKLLKFTPNENQLKKLIDREILVQNIVERITNENISNNY